MKNIITNICFLILGAATAFPAETRVDLVFCDKYTHDNNTLYDDIPGNRTSSFKAQGPKDNVFIVATFTPAFATGQGMKLHITKDGAYVVNRQFSLWHKSQNTAY